MPTKKTIYMQTTSVAAERTAAEIISALVENGATQVNTEYSNGQIVGLRWIMRVNGQDALFAMPARVAPVEKLLLRQRKGYLDTATKTRIAEQARHVAWRQLLRWVQAQLAMIQCGMVETAEVFFPYLQTPGGQSIFDAWKDQSQRMLGSGERAV